ncbi:hypothetical protein M3181_10310 [Mesobacillus maritimus]|uniref:hypothetical protein n=1 Tax=Mesobacillus maritimus TaxID=1643336 RepID=UPI00203D0AA4|nr:hypothetical protein [Mesobacillus maritimus]MCM3669387.1 hypothetical protein [Mesobacillus maritimus]
MSNRFFADYKKYIVIPREEHKFSDKGFDPHEFASHFILTLSIFDPVISSWKQASKHDINVEESITKVLDVFNQRNHGTYHLKLLEMEEDKTYFVLALSVKERIKPEHAEFEISDIIEKQISNPFYIGQSWYKFTSEKGRVERKLFCFSFKEYVYQLAAEK